MGDKKSEDVGKVWWSWFDANAFAVDKLCARSFGFCHTTLVVNFVTPLFGDRGFDRTFLVWQTTFSF